MFNVYTQLDPLAKFIVDMDPDAKSSMQMEKEAAARQSINDFFPKKAQTMSTYSRPDEGPVPITRGGDKWGRVKDGPNYHTPTPLRDSTSGQGDYTRRGQSNVKSAQAIVPPPNKKPGDNTPPPAPPINTDIQGDAPKPQPLPGAERAPRYPVKPPKAPQLPVTPPKVDQQKVSQAMPPMTPAYKLPDGPGGTFKKKKKLVPAPQQKSSQALPPVAPAYREPNGPGGTFKKGKPSAPKPLGPKESPKKDKGETYPLPQQKVSFAMLHDAIHGKQAQFGGIKPQKPGKPTKPISQPGPAKGNLAGGQSPRPMASSPSAQKPKGGTASDQLSRSKKAKPMEFGQAKKASFMMLHNAIHGENNV